jgi:hypothetical protein
MDSAGKTRTLLTTTAAITPRISADGKIVARSMGGNILLYDVTEPVLQNIGVGSAPPRLPRRLAEVLETNLIIHKTRANAALQTQKVKRSDACITRGDRVEITWPKRVFPWLPCGSKRAVLSTPAN